MRCAQEGVCHINCYRTIFRPNRKFSYIVLTQEYVRTWTGSVYLAKTEVRTPDRLVRSDSPYRLSFRGRRLDKSPYLVCYCEDCYKDNSSNVQILFLHTVKAYVIWAVLLHTFTISALVGSEWLVSRTCQCTLGRGDILPTQYGPGWATGAVTIFWKRQICCRYQNRNPDL
jgi:hypothetical protein